MLGKSASHRGRRADARGKINPSVRGRESEIQGKNAFALGRAPIGAGEESSGVREDYFKAVVVKALICLLRRKEVRSRCRCASLIESLDRTPSLSHTSK